MRSCTAISLSSGAPPPLPRKVLLPPGLGIIKRLASFLSFKRVAAATHCECVNIMWARGSLGGAGAQAERDAQDEARAAPAASLLLLLLLLLPQEAAACRLGHLVA